MFKGAVIIAHADRVNLTYGPATKHESQRVALQMIRTTQDRDVKQSEHVDGDKNTGGDGISRLPMQDDVNGNEICTSIKQHTFKDTFPLGMSRAQKE